MTYALRNGGPCRRPSGTIVVHQRTRVVSVQLPVIGHKTYGRALRQAFADSRDLEFENYWTSDRREVHARLFNRIMAQRAPIKWLHDRNLDFRRARAELGYAYFARRLIDRASREVPIDVLHFHTQTAALLCADYIRRVPTVITTDQTANQIALETEHRWRWTHLPSVALERRPLRLARAVVAFSHWAARSLVQDQGVDPSRVHVIPPGVDLRNFVPLDGHRERSHGNAKRFLFVGGDFERKGGPLLVDVFLRRFAQRGMELHLMTNAEGIAIHPQIFVHRDVQAYSTAWRDLFALADIFVLPTRWEAYGHAYVEAMAAALPVVGTNISAVPEIVGPDGAAFLIPPDDGQALAERLELLVRDADLRRTLGERGRQRAAANFDAGKSLEQLQFLFVQLAGKMGRGDRPSKHSITNDAQQVFPHHR